MNKGSKIVKLGRPVTIAWNKANLLWKNKNNKELAVFLGCTPARVCQMRALLSAKAVEEGKNPEKYDSRRKYARV